MDPEEARRIVLQYHRRSEHSPAAYARSLGYLDWASQPEPFRHFEGAERILLERPSLSDSPPYGALSCPRSISPAGIDHASVSRLLYDSLSLSAWKQAGETRWSLRVNPSSGNLHPIEAYVACSPEAGFCEVPGLFHYDPSTHSLARRLNLAEETWEKLCLSPGRNALLIGLTSIYWRESWKYGERAFRYCQLDLGHALACLAVAAAGLGWSARLVDPLATEVLERVLGTWEQTGPEAEHAEALVLIAPDGRERPSRGVEPIRAEGLSSLVLETFGVPNRLSVRHVDWPVIDEVAAATEVTEVRTERCEGTGHDVWGHPGEESEGSAGPSVSIRELVRQRRSAQAMDGVTSLDRKDFLRVVHRCVHASDRPPQEILPWSPTLSIACFVHRVRDMEPGLYLLLRRAGELDEYRRRLDPAFVWEGVDWPFGEPRLFLLRRGDYRGQARLAACGQEIASDGVVSFAMIADLRAAIERYGAWFYRRLFWEAGLLGQILYLEAEAAGIRGTGIGCYFDDLTRQLLGVKDRELECFYHFTLGGAVQDPRLQTLSAYGHLEPSSG